MIKEVFNDAIEVPSLSLPEGAQQSQVHNSSLWFDRAQVRKAQMAHLMWSPEKGIFSDYNTVTKEKTRFESVTCLWALWSGLATPSQADRLVAEALPLFEHRGGLSCTSARSMAPDGLKHQRQWDYPFGWAPHQIMAWDGLWKYGYHREAERLAYRWLHMITQTAVDYNGVIVEKYNVVAARKPHEIDAEYGNQGRDFVGVAREG